MAPTLRSRRLWLATAVAAVGVLCGCVNGSETDDSGARDAAIYRSVILDVVDRSGIELDGTEQPPVLFVEALGSEEIPLQVQVDVVGGFIEQYDIRFIDVRDEAVEIDLPGVPVRAGSLLIGLGEIDVDETAEVHTEVYVRIDDVQGFAYTLRDTGDGDWDVVDSPVAVEPEGPVRGP